MYAGWVCISENAITTGIHGQCRGECKHKRDQERQKTAGHETWPLPLSAAKERGERGHPEPLLKQGMRSAGRHSSVTKLKLSRFHLHIMISRSPNPALGHSWPFMFLKPVPKTSLGQTLLLSSTLPYMTTHHFGALLLISKLPMSLLMCWVRTKHQEIILNQPYQHWGLICQLLAWSGRYLPINANWDHKALWAAGSYLYIRQQMEGVPAFYFTERESGYAGGKWAAH